MRFHRSVELTRAIYDPDNQVLRDALKELVTNLRPKWAAELESRPNVFEFYADGLWVQYEIDMSGSETVIRAYIVDGPTME